MHLKKIDIPLEDLSYGFDIRCIIRGRFASVVWDLLKDCYDIKKVSDGLGCNSENQVEISSYLRSL